MIEALGSDYGATGEHARIRQRSRYASRTRLNISLFDAFSAAPLAGRDNWQIERFLCSQAIAMALEGIPAIYIHSLLATPNDLRGRRVDPGITAPSTAIAGTIPELVRHCWRSPDSAFQAQVFAEMKRMHRAFESGKPAFHPNATQFTLQLGDSAVRFLAPEHGSRAEYIRDSQPERRRRYVVPAMSLNLIGGDEWYRLAFERRFDTANSAATFEFIPYQCRWITNR